MKPEKLHELMGRGMSLEDISRSEGVSMRHLKALVARHGTVESSQVTNKPKDNTLYTQPRLERGKKELDELMCDTSIIEKADALYDALAARYGMVNMNMLLTYMYHRQQLPGMSPRDFEKRLARKNFL